MKLFVGNLNFRTSEDQLSEAFQEFGEVISAKIIMDRATGRSKGFGFVEMLNDEEAAVAMENLNGAEFDGKVLKIDYAKERTDVERRPRQSYNRRERY